MENNKPKVTVKGTENVNFGDVEIITYLSTKFDTDSPKEHHREVKCTFIIPEDASEDTKTALLDRLAASLRIKVNQTDENSELKSKAIDAKSYAEFLDSHNCEFTWNVDELLEPSAPSDLTAPQYVARMVKKGLITKEQAVGMLDAMEKEAAKGRKKAS